MREVYKDNGLLTATHHGANGAAALCDPDRDFVILSCVGRLLENVTQATSAAVASETTTTLTATGVTWNTGDIYILYVGATKGAVISSTEVCRKSGFAYPKWELGPGGIHPKHEDEDQKKMNGQRRRTTKLRR